MMLKILGKKAKERLKTCLIVFRIWIKNLKYVEGLTQDVKFFALSFLICNLGRDIIFGIKLNGLCQYI